MSGVRREELYFVLVSDDQGWLILWLEMSGGTTVALVFPQTSPNQGALLDWTFVVHIMTARHLSAITMRMFLLLLVCGNYKVPGTSHSEMKGERQEVWKRDSERERFCFYWAPEFHGFTPYCSELKNQKVRISTPGTEKMSGPNGQLSNNLDL